MRKSFDIDSVYWDAINVQHDASAGEESLDQEALDGIDLAVSTKMEQLESYREDCTVRFEKT